MSSATAPHRASRVSKFGYRDVLLGALTRPSGSPSQIGAILWGMGVAEMKTARRLAKYGMTCLQVRINGPDFNDDDKRNAIYDVSGVEYCRMAMDKLTAEHGVKTFILMGNCACANLSFNTAVVDARVTGLILTNPLILKEQMLASFFWERLVGLRSWKRLIGGKINLRANLKHLSNRLFTNKITTEGVASPIRYSLSRDVLLTSDLNQQLRDLCHRDVRILIACASNDDSFRYLGSRHREVLNELTAAGRLWFEKVASNAHVFSIDDEAATLLNDTVSRWVDATFGEVTKDGNVPVSSEAAASVSDPIF